jgi:hypothetical protein
VDDLSSWSGWLCVTLVVAAALVPLGHRALVGRRAVPGSAAIGTHVVIGFAATALALLHAFAVLPALGSPAAIRGGMAALLPATAAFFLLFAHVGVGLRLRNPRLRDRVKVRRWHVALALSIATTVAAHVLVLVRAS